jgi:hypothetical protein
VCPYGHGCPAGGCTGTGWQEWLKWHNVYRCMHNVPPVVWDMDVYQDCYNTFKDQSEMKHSDSYGVQPPAGPAGENLFKASYQANPQEAVASWYSEIKDCGPFPGCTTGASGTVGHFTSMIWNGVKEIGCSSGQNGLLACRYKASDTLSCATPNMAGASEQNVFGQIKDEATCVKEYDECLNAPPTSAITDVPAGSPPTMAAGHEKWADLSAEQQDAAQALGYDAKTWDKNTPVASNKKGWKELTPAEMQAAQVLGFDQITWDETDGGSKPMPHFMGFTISEEILAVAGGVLGLIGAGIGLKMKMNHATTLGMPMHDEDLLSDEEAYE